MLRYRRQKSWRRLQSYGRVNLDALRMAEQPLAERRVPSRSIPVRSRVSTAANSVTVPDFAEWHPRLLRQYEHGLSEMHDQQSRSNGALAWLARHGAATTVSYAVALRHAGLHSVHDFASGGSYPHARAGTFVSISNACFRQWAGVVPVAFRNTLVK